MSTMTIRGALCVAVLLAAAGGASAQGKPPPPAAEPKPTPTIEELQRQVEELTRQLAIVQEQLDKMQAQQEEESRQAELEKLRQAAAAEAARSESPQEVDTSTKFVSGTRMQPQLNPEISLTGNMYGVAGNNVKNQFSIGEWELDIRSYLDPYARVAAVFGWSEEEGFGLEEGYVDWLNLFPRMSLTVGRKRQQFGVLNRWHPHALDQVYYPWVIEESFGEEGLIGTGVSLDWLMPSLWADSNELIVEVTDGDNDVAFAGSDWTKPAILAYLKSYWDVTGDSYLEVDLTGLHGVTDPEGNLDHDFLAIDAVYNWYPAGRELYNDVTLRGMLLRSFLDLADGGRRDAWGGYFYGQYKFSRRWIVGARYDNVQDQREAGHSFWGISPYLTFWQSEFVRLRGEYTYGHDNFLGNDNRFTLQLTVAAGPHKHERY